MEEGREDRREERKEEREDRKEERMEEGREDRREERKEERKEEGKEEGREDTREERKLGRMEKGRDDSREERKDERKEEGREDRSEERKEERKEEREEEGRKDRREERKEERIEERKEDRREDRREDRKEEGREDRREERKEERKEEGREDRREERKEERKDEGREDRREERTGDRREDRREERREENREEGRRDKSREEGSEEEIDMDTEDSKQSEQLVTNWVESYSKEQLAIQQQADPDLARILDWLIAGITLTQQELAIESPAVKKWWLCKNHLELIDGILYYRWDNKLDRNLVLMVPKALIEEVLDLCYDTPSAGHLGTEKTLARTKQSFLWYNMSKDVNVYTKTCVSCSRNKKATKRPQAGLGTYHVGYPMERVHMDLLGPFNPSHKGNKYILMIIDQFSKWVECISLADQHAETVAQEFLLGLVKTFGCPLEIHTDQGKQFDGNLFKAFCDLLTIKKTRTTPYHPASNGQVERYNRVILQMIRCYVEGNSRNWDQHLPLLSMALHAMEHHETGFTPNQLMLGREVLMPQDLVLGTAAVHEKYTHSEWVKVQAEKLDEIYKIVRDNLKQTLQRQKCDYDIRVYETSFERGDLVYKLGITRKTGAQALMPVWKGPFLVLESTPPVYRLLDQKKKEKSVHHDRLKKCQDRSIPTWIKQQQYKILVEDGKIDGDQLEEPVGSEITTAAEKGKAQPENRPSVEPAKPEEEPSEESNQQVMDTDAEEQAVSKEEQPQQETMGEQEEEESKVEDSTKEEEDDGSKVEESAKKEEEDEESKVQDSTQKKADKGPGIEELTSGGVLQKLFKEPPQSKKMVLTMDRQPQLPTRRGRNIKVPTHLQDFVAK